MSLSFILVPMIGALIGWITNVLAIKLLFRPYRPIKIPIISYTLQGLIPKRQEEIARSIGETIERELISIDDILEFLKTDNLQNQTVEILIPLLKQAVLNKFPAIIPGSIKDLVASFIAEVLSKDLPGLLQQFSANLSVEIKKQISFSTLIQNKINEMDWAKLEQLVLDIARKELHHIEILGGVLGFIIGLLQLVIIIIFR